MSQSSSARWDWGRFWQTLNFFDAIPVVSWLKNMISGARPVSPPDIQNGIVFDFRQAQPQNAEIWGALDDVVMGGVSQSGFRMMTDQAVFTGNVSTANSGGFASIRTRNFEPPLNLASYSGVQLRVKGDGQRYKFLIRDSDTWDSIAYTWSFDTVDAQWIDVQVPFSQLRPVFRAKTVEQGSPLNTSQIRAFQLMLSKFEYDGALNPHFAPGSFQLAIQTISLY